jgi:8-oxo-dGTP pyrophosphatase MutT (NUDIX family)
MYKVFFNDSVVVLTDDFISNFQQRDGLFYKYRDIEELKELLSLFWEMKKIKSLFIFHHDLEELRELFRKCFRQIFAAGGLVRNKEGKVLVIYRRDKWDLPKGKLNKNESFEDAAVREVSEECGIHNPAITQPLLSTYHTYYLEGRMVLKKTRWFEMLYSGNEEPVPQIDEDITEIRWMKKEDLVKISGNTYPAIIDVWSYKDLL